jgi:hypothetical protein
LEVLVARDTCKGKEDGVKRALFLATAALLAMLVLAPMALAQDSTVTFPDSTVIDGTTFMFSGERTMADGSPVAIPDGGGPAILLPAAALLLGSGILTYAILRRR